MDSYSGSGFTRVTSLLKIRFSRVLFSSAAWLWIFLGCLATRFQGELLGPCVHCTKYKNICVLKKRIDVHKIRVPVCIAHCAKSKTICVQRIRAQCVLKISKEVKVISKFRSHLALECNCTIRHTFLSQFFLQMFCKKSTWEALLPGCLLSAPWYDGGCDGHTGVSIVSCNPGWCWWSCCWWWISSW